MKAARISMPGAVRIPPTSFAFTALLGLLVALPSFGIDMNLPALPSTAASLGVTPAKVGLAMSAFMIGFAGTPLIYGPVSDRYGRKPVVLFAAALFAGAGLGCEMAHSLPALLTWRIVQGAGAGASMTIALAIIRDLFEGQVARAKLSYVAVATMIVPMLAPTVGATLLAFGGWRSVYLVLAGVGIFLLLALSVGFSESAKVEPGRRLTPLTIASNYLQILTHPVCLGYILVNAAAFGALFAYVSGSPLFLIGSIGLRPAQYGLVFAATSLAIMAGAWVNGRLSTWNIDASYPLATGLALAALSAVLLLAMTLIGWMLLPVALLLLVIGNFAFGLIAPNTMHGTMQPLPQMAGAVGATAGCVQMAMGAVSSALVVSLHDGRSAASMTGVMALCSFAALAAYVLLVRPAARA
jgi:DHA1 family bicyclomycin/chloramphenicol resistance-like MFS transporter